MTDFSDILLVVDFDRTLTAPDSSIPQANLDAIRYFTDRGGLFTVGTGRSAPMYRPHHTRIPTNAPLILFNGAAAYDYATGILSGTVWMPTGRDLLEYITENFPDLWLEVQGVDVHYLIGENPAREAFYTAQGVDHRTVTVAEAPARYHKLAIFGDFTGEGVGQFYDGTPAELARFSACCHEGVERSVRKRFASDRRCEFVAVRVLPFDFKIAAAVGRRGDHARSRALKGIAEVVSQRHIVIDRRAGDRRGTVVSARGQGLQCGNVRIVPVE